MEKHVPHTRLATVKQLIRSGRVRITRSAVEDAEALGLSFQQVCLILLNLTGEDFYKSMTTYADHRIRQDVYRPLLAGRRLYLKITVMEDLLVVSFKEK